jgi:hypothetical protein
MKRRTTLSYIIVGTLLLLAGCASSSTGPDDYNSLPIMPLKVGNTWIGRTQEFDSAGIVTSTTFDTLRIISEQQIQGETWFRTNTGFLLTNRTDGAWFQEDRPPYGVEWQMAKHPAAVGDIFEVDTALIIHSGTPQGPDSIDVVSYHVLATGIEITVPAGTFSSTRYKQRDNRLDGTPIEYFVGEDYASAPGVGEVQENLYATKKSATNPSGKTYLSDRWELMEAILE